MSDGSTAPEISVVIPSYNAELTLGDQLDALARQQVPFAFEVLVCDNGSTDGTAELVQRWRARLPLLTHVDASGRRGASHARNVGAQHAHAALLAFCDADDVVSDSWLLELRNALQQARFVAGLTEHAALNPGREWSFGWSETEPTFTVPILPQLPAAGSGNLGIHAEVFAAVGGFDETLLSGEDLDLCWRIQLAGHALVGAPRAIAHIRKRDGLPAAFRQGYAKGAGTRQLAHNYAEVIEAYRRVTVVTPTPGAAPSPSPGRLRSTVQRGLRIPRKLARVIRSPAQLGPDVDRIGAWLGRRFGPIDRTAARVPPPETMVRP